MTDDLIVVTIVGSDADEGDVRLSDFADQLNAIRDALKETGHALYGRDLPDLEFRIVDLKHSSPSTVVIKPIVPARYRARAARVCQSLVSGLETIKTKKKAPAHADLNTLESYRDIAKPMQKHVQRVQIATNFEKKAAKKPTVVSIDRSFQETVEEIIGPDMFAAGSISGYLERVNLHNVQRFDIYPRVGPRRVRCSFGDDLMDNVRSGLKRHVTVFGGLRYKHWDKFPYAIDAKMIDIHETDPELPSIFELHGIAPEATGDMSSEEFVRSIRERDW